MLRRTFLGSSLLCLLPCRRKSYADVIRSGAVRLDYIDINGNIIRGQEIKSALFVNGSFVIQTNSEEYCGNYKLKCLQLRDVHYNIVLKKELSNFSIHPNKLLETTIVFSANLEFEQIMFVETCTAEQRAKYTEHVGRELRKAIRNKTLSLT